MKKETLRLLERLENLQSPSVVFYIRKNDCDLGSYMTANNISDHSEKLIIIATLDY